MSRLDSFIRRLEAQRACLDFAANHVSTLKGHVFELGLGNGRTYDHLRELFPERDIYVFERKVAAHPDCVPDADHLFEGDFLDTLPGAVARFEGQCALIHGDIGTGDDQQSAQLALRLSENIGPALAVGGLLVSDQRFRIDGFDPVPLPANVPQDRYHIFVRHG